MKEKGWEKKCHANINQKKAGVAILISKKVDLRAGKITKYRKELYTVMFKMLTSKQYIPILIVYANCAPNTSPAQM